MRRKLLLVALLSVSGIIPAYGQTVNSQTCLTINDEPGAPIPSTIAIGSRGNILAVWSFENLCPFDILIDNLSFLAVVSPNPVSNQQLLTNLGLSSEVGGHLGSASLTTTVAGGYLYSVLTGTGITVPANGTIQVTLTSDLSANAPPAIVNATIQIEIPPEAEIRATVKGTATPVGAIAAATGTPIKIVAASSASNPVQGQSNSPQIVFVAGPTSSLTISQITVSVGGVQISLLSTPLVIPAGQSGTVNLQTNGTPISGPFVLNTVGTVQ